jgi:hypothetical protein
LIFNASVINTSCAQAPILMKRNFLTYLRTQLHRQMLPLLAGFVMFAGIAQAAHFHHEDAGQPDTHLQCLLCLHAASGGGTPHVAGVVRITRVVQILHVQSPTLSFQTVDAASYDARGPPSV